MGAGVEIKYKLKKPKKRSPEFYQKFGASMFFGKNYANDFRASPSGLLANEGISSNIIVSPFCFE